MQQLRLVGVQEDGENLLLSNDAGEEFSLPVNESLRSAAMRPIGRPSAQAADAATGVLAPKDIQARIRAGASAEQVASEFGLDLDRVRKYEGPVLAERDWTAQLARRVEVASPQPGHDLYRSTFGDEPATLGEMVSHRISAMGMDSSTLRWDAWRGHDGTWTVVAEFSTEGLDASVDDQPPAVWSFRPASSHLDNRNRWAQVLSELDPLDGPFGGRRLAAVGDRPFNVEEEDVPSPSPFPAPASRGPRPAVDADSQDELLDVLRARRGQRLGVDEEGDDELALMLTRDEQPAPEPSERPRLRVAGQDEDTESPASSSAEALFDDHGSDDDSASDDDEDDSGHLPLPLDFPTRRVVGPQDEEDDEEWIQERSARNARGGGRHDRHGRNGQIAGQTDALEPSSTGQETPDPEPHSEPEEGSSGDPDPETGKGGRRRGRQKRATVPSWDEIVFGRKND
ncbi:septation protein SepH [Micrococcus terreus]|uniref:septation protein SepH n=1 Tax=Micrococcus terreus TaxID=574650 RepID=UPI00254E3366|nr:septation protein SepH [Micrococcus terreus]MDK7700207.1 septation protein SepH [Micrococcus terreus]WOO98467.1 septation protein SepH [Micrococcus terreus]